MNQHEIVPQIAASSSTRPAEPALVDPNQYYVRAARIARCLYTRSPTCMQGRHTEAFLQVVGHLLQLITRRDEQQWRQRRRTRKCTRRRRHVHQRARHAPQQDQLLQSHQRVARLNSLFFVVVLRFLLLCHLLIIPICLS